jgi:hypothetical protein
MHGNANRISEDRVFVVKPDIQNDVYRLFVYTDRGELVFHGYAGVQSYDTSVMMNKLFRNIKENENLDTLEESDSEDEFENTSVSKYVRLDTVYRMVCSYTSRINKWIPQKVAGRNQRVATQRQTCGLGECRTE